MSFILMKPFVGLKVPFVCSGEAGTFPGRLKGHGRHRGEVCRAGRGFPGMNAYPANKKPG